MNNIFYNLCQHSCSIIDGWIPYPSTCIAYSTKIELPVVRKELRRLKKAGLVDSDLLVEPGEDRPILIRGYVVTAKGRDTEEYCRAWEIERQICKECFEFDIGEANQDYSSFSNY